MERTSSCSWVKGVLEMFGARGLDVPALVAAAGIEPARLANPQERFGADEISALWQHAVAASGDETLGLDRETCARHVNFDLIAYAMASSPDLRSGLAQLARYMAVISDAASFELVPQGEDAWLVLGGSGFSRPVPRQRYAYGVLSLLTVCQWVTRRPIEARAIDFKFAQPADVQRYHDAFRCPLRFGQADNRLLLSAADLAFPIPSRDASMLAFHEHVLGQRLAALGNSSIAYRVSEAIVRRLHRGEPRREEVAASLAMADRTLQRRLHEEHTSFQQLLDEARCELARKYLAEEDCSLPDVADRLGFGDASNFHRACKRWFGQPPGLYRQQLFAAPPAGRA